MTRSEAIDALDNLLGMIEDNHGTDYDEAIKMAINALKQFERKKGKWVWMGDKGDSRFMCSVCKCKENVPTIMGNPIVWDFCPNCGAEMRAGDDAEDIPMEYFESGRI